MLKLRAISVSLHQIQNTQHFSKGSGYLFMQWNLNISISFYMESVSKDFPRFQCRNSCKSLCKSLLYTYKDFEENNGILKCLFKSIICR